ncbi:sensor histidine kinase [Hymenobacter bucti]|uniref:histidine kinase n=1 Tax=Hymenobacter bucti TaxID=1844114 RepID=A0ABW4QRY5_9BACT
MADSVPRLLPDGDANPAGLVEVLLTISPTGTMLLRPVYGAAGELIEDFDWVRLNPAAQQLLQLPEQPAASFLTLFPAARQAGVFEFYREAFLAGSVAQCSRQCQHDGLSGYYIAAAQRHEQLLVVSLCSAHNSAPVAEAPAEPASGAREPAPPYAPLPAAQQGLGAPAHATQLAEQQTLLRQILRQVPAAVATLSGPEHRYTFFNDQYWALSAQRVELDKTVDQILPELVEQGFVAMLDQVYATGQPVTGTDKPVQLLDRATGRPEQRYLDFIYQPLFDKQGQAQGILAFLVDTTERVLARRQVEATNRELATANARLTRTNSDLDIFVYSASHDLRAPIANIEGLLLALRQELPVEAWQAALVPRLLELMDGAVARFQQTLGYLTDVTRLQPEATDHTTELVELPALVEAVRLDILPELTAARATLNVSLEDYPVLFASPKLLRSIFYNLLSNAIKYRAPDRPPLVQLRCRRAAPGYLALEVQDNGLGLTAKQQSSLFQLFKRMHTHVSGSGVGLYMVKKMVDNAGGTLTVQSQPGVGSTFTVTLPLSDRPLP